MKTIYGIIVLLSMPGFPGQVYRGHAPDEYLTKHELMLIADLTTAAVWQLCGKE